MAAKRRNSSRLARQSKFSAPRGVLISTAVAVFGFLLIFRILASPPVPTLTLDPTTVTVRQGDTFKVNVELNAAGLAIANVDVDLTYPKAKLQLVTSNPVLDQSVSLAPSSPVGVPTSSVPASQTNLVIGSFTFKALGDTSTATIGFANDTTVTVAGITETINPGTTVTVTFTPPNVSVPLPPVLPPVLPPTAPPPSATPPPPTTTTTNNNTTNTANTNSATKPIAVSLHATPAEQPTATTSASANKAKAASTNKLRQYAFWIALAGALVLGGLGYLGYRYWPQIKAAFAKPTGTV